MTNSANQVPPTNLTMETAAAMLDIGRNTLFKRLREKGHFKKTSQGHNLPSKECYQAGYFNVEYKRARKGTTGMTREYALISVTPAGMRFLERFLREYDDEAANIEANQRRHRGEGEQRALV